MGGKILGIVSLVAMAAAVASPAKADVIFTTSGTLAGNSVNASATFAISGNALTVTLQNTSGTNSQEAPGSTLTGFSFLLGGGSPTLTPSSAISPNAIFDSGACDVTSCTGTNVNVGGEWGYQSNFSNGTLNVSGVEGIGSSGYITTGLSGDLGNFNGVDLESPKSLDGIEFGVISANHGAFNGGLSNQALIDDTIVLTLLGVSNFKESDISGVTFFYGTPDGSLPGAVCVPGGPVPCGGPPVNVPEPNTLALFGGALVALGFWWRRRNSV